MTKFQGFSDAETFTSLPDSFFRQLLNEIADAGELKVILYALWRSEHMEGRLRYLRRADFAEGLGEEGLEAALAKAVERGSLLRAQVDAEMFYFLNSPRGRAAVEAVRSGQWHPLRNEAPSAPPPERPNIYRLYEENIGPLTPLLADALKDAEQTYAAEWIEEAFEIAVKNNKRNWRYIEAILKRWKEEGHAKKQDRRDAKEIRGRDVTRKVEDFLKR